MLVLGVALAGALGALARYGVTELGARVLAGTALAGAPLGTLTVNVIGSFLLGLMSGLAPASFPPPVLRVALATGFLGSLTTFSTFELETAGLFGDGRFGWGAIYVVASVLLGLAALLLGRFLAVVGEGAGVGP